jgi:hypothetical protein
LPHSIAESLIDRVSSVEQIKGGFLLRCTPLEKANKRHEDRSAGCNNPLDDLHQQPRFVDGTRESIDDRLTQLSVVKYVYWTMAGPPNI